MKRARCAMASERVFIPSLVQRVRAILAVVVTLCCVQRGTLVYARDYIHIYV